MSAKWRALQHRHRYTYSSVVFPASFLQALDVLEGSDAAEAAETAGTAGKAGAFSSPYAAKFIAHLKNIASLDTMYAQVAAAKDVCDSFVELLAHADNGFSMELVSAAAKLYLEVLFLENSLPLHRTLISAIARSRKSLPVVEICLLSLCSEFGRVAREGRMRFPVSRAVLSLMGYPKLGFLNGVIERCARLVAVDVAMGLAAVTGDIDLGLRPSPTVMEQCQDAMSCLYYLLQRFPSKFAYKEEDEEENSQIFETVLRAILGVLKSSAFSRDCLVAAGVSFFAGLQAKLSPQELANFIAQGFFRISSSEMEIFDARKLLDDGDLFADIREFSILSRVCLFRGMLTTVTRTVLNTHFMGSDGLSVWTILYNGILRELCHYCENPVDSHYNFHMLTVTQICLQQIKASLSSDLTDFSGDYDPLPDDITGRLLRIMWNNLEDPLNQTVKQVHLIFDLFLDIKSLIPSEEGSPGKKSFLYKIASDLLNLGPRCKGRYVPLASLTRRLSAKVILEIKPNLIFETISAYIDDDVCCAATSFLKCFLECLRDECWSSYGVEQGYYMFRGFCLPPVMDGLLSGISKLRSNLNTYGLPVLLDTDVDSIFNMLTCISIGPIEEENGMQCVEEVSEHLNGQMIRLQQMDITSEQCVAALVSLLKVSRQLALVEGDIDWEHHSSIHAQPHGSYATVCVKGVSVKVPVAWFEQALTHVDENLRMDAAESLFLNPKTASLPSNLELRLMREVIPLNMRCSSTAFQMKWNSLFRKFFSRVQTALERQVKQGWKPNECSLGNENGYTDSLKYENIQRAMDLFGFMKWLSNFLFYSCYPSAPYERKTMAMGLILIMLDVWPAVSLSQECTYLCPYSEEFTSPDSTLLFVGSIIDSWDRLRVSSFHILLYFPSPLPGMSSYDSVRKVISWAKKLVCSPRVRESDAGALTLRLIFKKYVLELGWTVGVSADIVCFSLQSEVSDGASQDKISKERTPVVQYLSSLIDWLRIIVEEGERDLSEACRNCFVHGILLTLRYTFEELDWNLVVDSSSSSEMRIALEELLDLVMRITSLALWVVSADAWHLPDESDDMVGDEALLSDISVEIDPDSTSESVEGSLTGNGQTAQQIVMVGCWLAMKEVSLLLGTIIRKIPLPSCSPLDPLTPAPSIGTSDDLQMMVASDMMLDLKQLEAIGNHFLQVLLKMKHNGAIDKTRAGFTALCNRLLCSNDPRLCKMTESWMEQLMERTIAKGQTVDDLLRRSAGIPAAFMALFLSEPEGAPKKLLPYALGWLIEVAKKSCISSVAYNCSNIVLPKESSGNSNKLPMQPLAMESDLSMKVSKIRDEGVIPTVHAFNVLRAAFNDTNLAADTSGFCAEALIISIHSFSSPCWEVRNSACLAYTALIRRMIGFLNVQRRESARRALTGLEFFHRYPPLHSFLFEELKIATKLLGDGFSESSKPDVAKAIHPSLCPILILLSRLKPSTIGSDVNDALDPFLFMPFIKKCAMQSNLRVRVLASKAITGLVSNEKLPALTVGVAQGLPSRSSTMERTESGFHISSPSSESNDCKTLSCSISFNAMHGILVQLNSLLDINCRNLNDISKKDLILGNLIQVLQKCSWIGSFKLCSCPTLISSYLRVLDHMFVIARMCKSSNYVNIQSLLLKLSSECLDGKQNVGLAFYDPTVVEVQKQAAISFFSCFFGVHKASEQNPLQTFASNSSETCKNEGTTVEVQEKPEESNLAGLQEKISSCISDSSHEVRLVMLKLLLQFLKTINSNDSSIAVHLWANEKLQLLLTNMLGIEENPKCIYYILRNIYSWNLLYFVNQRHHSDQDNIHIGTMDCDSVLSFWERLVALANFVRRSKTREILICCMGLCIRRFRLFGNPVYVNQLHAEEKIGNGSFRTDLLEGHMMYNCIDKFIVLLEKRSAPSEPVNIRKAAAESIVASGLLEEAVLVGPYVRNEQIPSEELPACNIKNESSVVEEPQTINVYGCRILDVWFTCIQLLEDEDVGLRQKLAKDVQSCMDCYMSRQRLTGDTAPMQVESVIKSSFEFLSSVFGHWIEYVNYLLKCILQSGDYEIARSNLVRQVFDKEIDNHHEEKLLVCQICCSHLERLLFSPPLLASLSSPDLLKHKYITFLSRWTSRFVHRLISFADDHIKDLGRADWVGGIGNHKDAFMPVYANLLGLYALLRSPKEGFYLPEELTEGNKLLSSDFVCLNRIIRPFLTNPLIANLYYLVILSLERILGTSVTYTEQMPREISTWEKFNPYFLLK
ncbi:hypothetical protein Taro_011398 [Colocasia esculenta]|uniref:DUF2428 domain-containing protein n=1 Tax=Colocasia esculenta TaxID=4460 RepID=A0A843UA23_COLES|nr:hypothetical protein [Colocasia esculenta]